MVYGLTVSSQPAVEPVSVSEAKTHLRVETSDDDTYIGSLISAARQLVELQTRRTLITQSFELTLDRFPQGAIRIPRSPVQSITSIVYLDENGDEQTLDSSLYRLNETTIVASVAPEYGESWPSTLATTKSVTLTFVAGYGDAADDVPEPIKHAIKLMIGTYYDPVRQTVVMGDAPSEVPQSASFLLGPYMIKEFAR